jgi:hypothetical protein
MVKPPKGSIIEAKGVQITQQFNSPLRSHPIHLSTLKLRHQNRLHRAITIAQRRADASGAVRLPAVFI